MSFNPFDLLTHHLMLPLLAQAYALTGNYGWAIILLTVLIQLLLLPLTLKPSASTQNMQQMPGLLKALQERYQHDPEELKQQQRLLLKAHPINPVGGCLPMLVQMLFLFALYDALSGEAFTNMLAAPGVAKSFLILPDLSHLGFYQSGHLYFENVMLLVLFALSTLLQQKLMMPPMAADTAPRQAALQKKTQLTMPMLISLVFILFPVPTGIFIHLVTLNLMGMGQHAYLNWRNQQGLGHRV